VTETARVVRPRAWFVGTVAVVILLDQVTKAMALEGLSGGRTVDIVWTLRLNLTFNYGMAFSAGTGAGPLIGTVALGVAAWVARLGLRSAAWSHAVVLGLVCGGALGNVIDRLFRGDGWMRGGVVDFIDLQWFPVFNLADSAITVGAAAIVLAGLAPRR
jgi:signal peptidase II